MTTGFHSIHFNVTDRADQDLEAVGARPLALRGGGPARAGAPEAGPGFNSEEAAARFYLSRLFGRDERASLRGLTAPERPEVVPDMRLRDSQRSPLTGTWTVRFVQTKATIPVFGSRAVVELDRNRELLSVDAELADVKSVSPATRAGVPEAALETVEPPELTYYHDDGTDQWHLVYFFRNVPAAPPGFLAGTRSHGLGRSPAQRHPDVNYLVDAHDGAVLLYWSAAPTLEIPSQCRGADEDGAPQVFWGRRNGAAFEMSDPIRGIRTFDFGLNDVDTATPPAEPIGGPTSEFKNAPAVSAHVNAMRVYDFYKSVLLRDGVDDKGMELISYVNCTVPAEEPPPEWHNAVWWKRRMWYGQARDVTGALRSYARHLDAIAHELTHGVTEFTADLAYLRQSGALNESFSDIFAIIVKNWDVTDPATGGSVDAWSWEIGSGFRAGGLPLRDMRDPTRTGDPAHMDQYVNTAQDNGGVHSNSNIHNKAAYNVLTAKDGQGQPVFTPREVAVLYYLCLTRLDKLATFSQTLQTLRNVASTYYAGDAQRQPKLDALTEAYAKVGIA
jgi:bacillolysin/neutral peptidase B